MGKRGPKPKPKPPKGPPKRCGPVPRVIDWDDVGRMARVHCPLFDLAAIVKISEDQLRDRCMAETGFSLPAFLAKHRSSGRQILRNIQLKSAAQGSITMQIWLGKQWLGQTDKVVKYDRTWAANQSTASLVRTAQEAISVLESKGALHEPKE